MEKTMNTPIESDVIVVGTGPGGATVARELARRKKSILMLEWGDFNPIQGTFSQFVKGAGIPGKGFLLTQDLCAMVRGVTTGGSSVFYYATAFDPPLDMFDARGIDLRPAIEEIRNELPVGPLSDDLMGPAAKRLLKSARELGLDWRKLPKFIDQKRCKPDCHRCNYGCPEGAKWSGRMFVTEALLHGAHLETGAKVERVLVENGKAVGVAYRKSGRCHRAYGRTVVLSAGGIGSPLILRQSGIRDAGFDFFFDPLMAVMGTVADLCGGREIPMAGGMHVAADGYVMTDMTVPAALHRLLNAQVGRFDQVYRHARTLHIMIKIKDQLGGRLTDRGGIRKRLTENDKAAFSKGYARAKEILVQAGARDIHRSWYLAAHPGGTVKIDELVDSDLKTAFDDLFVCDCSVMPGAWGLPPTFSLIALGKRLAKHLCGDTGGIENENRHSINGHR
jgi:choline dehydrogenase-like flavoprotein